MSKWTGVGWGDNSVVFTRTAVDFGVVAEGTPCGKGVMGYF